MEGFHIAQWKGGQRLENCFGHWPLQCQLGKARARIFYGHIAGSLLAKPAKIFIAVGGVHADEKVMRVEAINDDIVDHAALIVQDEVVVSLERL
jgi:hypothetical protein